LSEDAEGIEVAGCAQNLESSSYGLPALGEHFHAIMYLIAIAVIGAKKWSMSSTIAYGMIIVA
jgi:hypothetical protein